MSMKNPATPDSNRRRVVANITGDSRTQQNFKKECDINTILKKFRSSGLLTHVNQRQPMYEDVSNFTGYQEALEIVMTAEKLFNDIPAAVRKKFNNDPQEFLDFVSNPSNGEELVKLGLAEMRPQTIVAAPPIPTENTDGAKS